MTVRMDKKEEVITIDDAPLCCPPLHEVTWQFHPRVWLRPDEKGEALCPYCSTRYKLKESYALETDNGESIGLDVKYTR